MPEFRHSWGNTVSEGGLEPPCPLRALAPQASASAYSATRTRDARGTHRLSHLSKPNAPRRVPRPVNLATRCHSPPSVPPITDSRTGGAVAAEALLVPRAPFFRARPPEPRRTAPPHSGPAQHRRQAPRTGPARTPSPPQCNDRSVTADNVTAQDEVVDICRDLIRIDTSNPGDHSGPAERQAAEYVAARLSEVGLEPAVLESHPKRTSAVAS